MKRVAWTAACLAIAVGSIHASDPSATGTAEAAVVSADTDADGSGDTEQLVTELQELRARIESLEGQMGASLELSAALARLQARLSVVEDNGVKVFHKDGLRIEGNGFKYRIGGRIHNDYTFGSGDGDFESNFGDLEDSVEFRRARFYITGSYDGDVEWKAQFDLADGDSDFKDMYLRFKKLPLVGDLTVGQQKEPMSLEELTSSNYITFLERSLMNVLVPGRSTGVQSSQNFADKRGVLQVGIFKEVDAYGEGTGDGQSAFTARVAGQPIYEDEGRHLLHLGFSFSHRKPMGDEIRYRARPEVHDMQRVLDTGTFDADEVKKQGVEIAYVNGPFSVQAERMDVAVDSTAGSNPDFSGHYVQCAYTLTGEHRPYKQSSAAFSRLVPENPAVGKDADGRGAVELALRYSMLDLTDGMVMGGEAHNWTAGVNWYLSRNVRMMLNYIDGNIDDYSGSGGGDFNAVTIRVQADF